MLNDVRDVGRVGLKTPTRTTRTRTTTTTTTTRTTTTTTRRTKKLFLESPPAYGEDSNN